MSIANQMNNLPEDCQRLIWKKVYDSCLQDIQEGYIMWIKKKRMALQWNTQGNCKTYINLLKIDKYYFKEMLNVYEQRKDLKLL